MSKMKLIEAYIYEVTRRLPEKMRSDIALELRSTIEDMLPGNYSEVEVKNVLSKLGNPVELAASYRDTPRYLIGPQVYDSYISTLKLVIPWAIFITFLVQLVQSIVLFTGEDTLLTAIIKTSAITLANIITVLLQVLFWITIAFVILERTKGLKGNIPMFINNTEWTPDDLKNTVIIPKEKNIPISDIAFSLLGAVFLAILYFNADHFVGIYQSDDTGKLIFTAPFFNQEILLSYSPIIVIIILLEIVFNLYKLKIRKWTIPLAIINTFVHLLSTIVFILIVSNPNLIHEAFIPQMADTIQTNPSTVATLIDRIIWISIVVIIVINIIDVINGFRKAKIQ